MNAHASPPVSFGVPFVVPADDVRWCAALAEALSICCAAPSDDRVTEVRALLAAPPEQMLTAAWDELVRAGWCWLTVADATGKRRLFEGMRQIEAALRDMPVPPPTWAERYR